MNVAFLMSLALTSHNPSPLPPPVKMEASGTVREVQSGDGIKAQAVLALDDKNELVLHGRSETDDQELIRLNGVKVKIKAVKGDPLLPRGNHVRVEEFEILDVGGGVVPRLGRIATIDVDGKARLMFVDDDGRADFLPSGYMTKMQRNVGARLWMIGTKDKGGDFVPTRFAILRTRNSKPVAETP